jgi:hypothetical protein
VVGEARHRRDGGEERGREEDRRVRSEAWLERSVTLQTGCRGESCLHGKVKRGLQLFV